MKYIATFIVFAFGVLTGAAMAIYEAGRNMVD